MRYLNDAGEWGPYEDAHHYGDIDDAYNDLNNQYAAISFDAGGGYIVVELDPDFEGLYVGEDGELGEYHDAQLFTKLGDAEDAALKYPYSFISPDASNELVVMVLKEEDTMEESNVDKAVSMLLGEKNA